jgi:hypothetical protein
MMAGYSGAPLAKKLGWKAPMTVFTIDAPRDYPEWLAGLPAGVRLSSRAPAPLQAAVSEVWSGLKLVIRKSERP